MWALYQNQTIKNDSNNNSTCIFIASLCFYHIYEHEKSQKTPTLGSTCRSHGQPSGGQVCTYHIRT